MPSATPRSKLVAALRERPQDQISYLQIKKEQASELRKRPDLIWFLLLQSAATLGNSRGAERLLKDDRLLETISYHRLAKLGAKKAESTLLKALRHATVRMPTIKATRLAKNIEIIKSLGGVEAATAHMLSLPSWKAKFNFAISFHGIGEKYGRNLWMDIYDPHFVERIAVDSRLKKIADAIGFKGRRYCESESLFQSIAEDSGLEPWELDRLLYGFTEHYVKAATGR